MDPRYQWPPPGYANGQYAPPPQPNSYQANGYPVQYQQQPMHPQYQQYPQSQPSQGPPRVMVPPRPSQQYPPAQNGMGAPPRQVQPQVVIPARNQNMSPMAQMQNPRIRQVQVPAQRNSQMQRSASDAARRDTMPAQHRQAQAQAQTPTPKTVHRSQSFQENPPRPQQRTPQQTVSNQTQHRTPLQPQSTPNQRTPSSQHPPNQHQSPRLPQTPSSQSRSHPQVVIKSKQQQSPPKSLPTDLTVLLLHAADEYINAAHAMGSIAALAQKNADLAQYHKLMSTGLGCMEAILRRYNQGPRDEAKLRLRYASLLVEETENDIEIEEVLSKGIALCSRNRLLDLKYSMQHLQARFQFKSNHRAALKSLDGPIQEAETFQHVVWVYAFRFLKVSLALQVPGRPESASALQQLHAIVHQSEKRGDRAIFVTASALEAMIHLRTPGLDHLEQAQRAIASARSYQLQASTKELGQVAALIDCVDIACSLQQGKPDRQKMEAMQQKADKEPGPDNGVFSVLIEKSFGGNLTLYTGGIFTKAQDGRDELVFSWLPRNDFKMLAYYLSGMTTIAHDASRGVTYIKEGYKVTQQSLHHQTPFPTSISTSIRHRTWVATLHWQFVFTLGLLACRSEELPLAKDSLMTLRKRLNHAPFKNGSIFALMLSYLSGVIDQSKGSFDTALATYAQDQFTLPNSGSHADFKTDIAILATMNRILVVRNPAHPEHYLMGVLFSQLEPVCANHPNRFIEVAFSLVRAITTTDNSINRHKTLIHNALSAAQKLNSHQLMTMCLCYMSSRFFADTVGEQTLKSVRAARSIAKQNKSVLWIAVAYGLCINTLYRNGMLDQARECQQSLREVWNKLPLAMQAGMQNGGGGGAGFVGGSGSGDVMMG
ncbi:hypothetical protein K491DRAFT_604160 [Lophiostoma macrostomum CBS 122681]|uniref:Cohesin loading factor-domain-containing protein n=1 Tax=Lophiostoma macrostomum CBS 122681 TaxID=1314788 RepID=A0A6A6SZ56_9PLEO|nr:hypothetical protein K491DRAFT_604160 [Lophiostoma macrostomum CBS 122681]